MTTDETPKKDGLDEGMPDSIIQPEGSTPPEDPGQVDPPKDPVTLDDVKEAMSETGERLRSAGLAAFVDPIVEGLGDITRKAFSGLGKLLDEIDDRKRK
jgi:hypothetical protein